MSTLEPKPTQCEKVLAKLIEANGEWVNGRVFLRDLYLSQYHTRIFELQVKGHRIEASDFKDFLGFKSYRLKV
jgi:hypothetical protein